MARNGATPARCGGRRRERVEDGGGSGLRSWTRLVAGRGGRRSSRRQRRRELTLSPRDPVSRSAMSRALASQRLARRTRPPLRGSPLAVALAPRRTRRPGASAATASCATPRPSSSCANTPPRSSAPPASTPTATKIVLVNDRSFNAFVANGQKIFINVGALMDAETPNEVIGVHRPRDRPHRRRASRAPARADRERPDPLGRRHAARGRRRRRRGALGRPGRQRRHRAPWASLAGGQELVRRNLLSYQRSEEQAADQAAVRYLKATGQSPKGMLDDLPALRRRRAVPLARARPLPHQPSASRPSASRQLETLAKQSPHFAGQGPARPAGAARPDARRSSSASSSAPDTVLRRYPPHEHLARRPAMPARSLAYRSGRSREALSAIDGLIAEQPDNPYFHELKGQALLESRPRPRGGRAAAPGGRGSPRTACRSAPCSARRSLASGDPKLLDEAIRELSNATAARARDPPSLPAPRHRLRPQGQHRPWPSSPPRRAS